MVAELDEGAGLANVILHGAQPKGLCGQLLCSPFQLSQ